MDPWQSRAQRYLILALVFPVILAIAPFTPDPSVDTKAVTYVLAACAALLLWALTPVENMRWRPTPVAFCVWAFLAINVVAATQSVNVGFSLQRECVQLTALTILAVTTAAVFRTPQQAWSLLASICLAVSLASCYGLAQRAGLDPFPWDDPSRMLRQAPATFGNPNVASHVLAPALVFACGLYFQKRMRWAVVCAGLFIAHFSLTRTRGALFALAGTLLLLAVLYLAARRVKNPSRAVALSAAAVLGVFFMTACGVGLYYLKNTGSPYPDDSSLTPRFHSFYGACRMIADEPWLGRGPGMFQVANPDYWTDHEQEHVVLLREVNTHVHNEPLEIAADAGLPAGIVYTAILVLCGFQNLVMGLRSREPSRRILGLTLGAFFCTFLLDGIFGFNVHVPSSAVLFFLLIGLSLGIEAEDGGSVPCPASRAAKGGVYAVRGLCCGLACALAFFGVRDYAGKVFYQHGMTAMDAQMHAEASLSFTKAEALAPYDWRFAFQHGTALSRMGEFAQASVALSRAVDLHPGDIVTIQDAAKAFFNLASSSAGDEAYQAMEASVAYANRASRLNPRAPDAFDSMGRVAMLRAERLNQAHAGSATSEPAVEEWQRAEELLTKAIELGSKNKGELWRLVASTRMRRDNPRGAMKALARALDAKPDDVASYRLYLEASRSAGDYAGLLGILDWQETVMSRARKYDDAVGMLDLVRARAIIEGYGETNAARETLVKAAKEQPADPEVWAALRWFAAVTGQKPLLATAFREQLPGLREAETALPGEVAAAVEGLEEGDAGLVAGVRRLTAVAEAGKAAGLVSIFPEDRFSWVADVLSEKASSLKQSPQVAGEVHIRLAAVYGQCNLFDEAAAHFDAALPHLTGAQRVMCLFEKGSALQKAGKARLAAEAYQQVVAAQPQLLDARLGLARALAEAGEKARARVEYRTVLANFPLDEATHKAIQDQLNALAE